MSILTARRFLLAAASFLAVGTVVLAADPPATGGKDILDEAQRRDQVAQQKVEADFRAALIEMSKLEAANPARAAERLKKMLGVLEEDTTLSPNKREAWKRILKDRIRVSQAEAARAEKGEADDGARDAKRDDRKTLDEQKAQNEAKAAQEFKEIRKLQLAGNIDEARQRATDLATRHPDSPAAAASRYITGIASTKAGNDAIKAERGNRYLMAMSDVEKSAMPPSATSSSRRPPSGKRSPGCATSRSPPSAKRPSSKPSIRRSP